MTKFTYHLEMHNIKRKGRDDQTEDLKQMIKSTYTLETDEWKGWDDKMRELKTNDHVHSPPGDG